jgi:hypothetical protein
MAKKRQICYGIAMVRYNVYLDPHTPITVQASKLNHGQNWLWFFDDDNHLVALFLWKKILGFAIEGSAEGQILTDRVPLEMGSVPPEEYGELTKLNLREREERRKEREQREAGRRQNG